MDVKIQSLVNRLSPMGDGEILEVFLNGEDVASDGDHFRAVGAKCDFSRAALLTVEFAHGEYSVLVCSVLWQLVLSSLSEESVVVRGRDWNGEGSK